MAAGPSNYHGVVWTEVAGLNEAISALNEIATKFPVTFKKALAAEVTNLKRSISATLKNYKILKAVPVPNLTEATSYRGVNLARRSQVSKILKGPKHVSGLAKPGSVKIESTANGFEVGHFGGLSKYASGFQDGVPRHIEDKGVRHWMYIKLGTAMNVHTHERLLSAIAPISPPRPYIQVLAEKCGRDFIPGLVKCFERIANGEMKKAGKK